MRDTEALYCRTLWPELSTKSGRGRIDSQLTCSLVEITSGSLVPVSLVFLTSVCAEVQVSSQSTEQSQSIASCGRPSTRLLSTVDLTQRPLTR